MKEDLLKIINRYGVMPQLKYFQSEVFELNEAIINYENSLKEPYAVNMLPLKEHIAEEIGDVRFMLRQFQEFYGITDEEIDEVEIFKGKRQLERIGKEDEK